MITKMLDDLVSPDVWTRIDAEARLAGAGEAAITALCVVVADDAQLFERRWRAAMLLGVLADAQAVPPLMHARKASELDLRQGAIWALGCISHEATFNALYEIFADADEEEQIRFMTARALIRIDTQRALPLLQAALDGQEAQRRAAHAVLGILAELEQAG